MEVDLRVLNWSKPGDAQMALRGGGENGKVRGGGKGGGTERFHGIVTMTK